MPYGALDTGCGEQIDLAGTGSFYNDGEADIVTQHVLNLVHCGMYIFFLDWWYVHISTLIRYYLGHCFTNLRLFWYIPSAPILFQFC